MTLSKFSCVTYMNNKGKTVVDYSKISLISVIVSICLGMTVFMFMLSKEDKSLDTRLELSDIQLPKPFTSSPVFVSADTWTNPI